MAEQNADIKVVFGTDEFNFPFGIAVGIQKDFNRSDDGTVLNEKHVINLKGVYANPAGANNPLDSYKTLIQNVHERAAITYRSLKSDDRQRSLQADKLKLMVKGSDAFNDKYFGAILTSVGFGEAPEDTGGFQYQEVSLTFECYASDDDITQTFSLKSMSETFEIKREDDKIFYGTDKKFEGVGDKPYYTFTISHTISAQGYSKVTAGTKSEAFNEAYKYVLSRKKESFYNVSDLYDKDINDQTLLGGVKIENNGAFKISGGDAANSETPYDLSNYEEWNVTNTESIDVAGGSYSLTRTYYYSPTSYTLEITGSYEKSEDGDDSVKVDGTVTGLQTSSVYEIFHDKFEHAQTGFRDIAGSGNVPTQPFGKGTPIYKFAEKTFTDNAYSPFYNSLYVLDDRPVSTSVSQNVVAGTIQFSSTYKPIPAAVLDLKKQIPNCISLTINSQEENPYNPEIPDTKYQMKHVIPVMILGRDAGPIIQDMSTIKESYKSVTLEATVDILERHPDSKCTASGIKLVVDKYAPNRPNVKLIEISDTFDWATGKLNISAKWIYTR